MEFHLTNFDFQRCNNGINCNIKERLIKYVRHFRQFAEALVILGLEEDNQNFLLMHAIGANVSGQIASVIAGGLILNLVPLA